MEKKYWVPALERGTAILTLIGENPGQLRLIDISKTLDINKSSLFSLLNTLSCLGLICKDKSDTYSLGAKLGSLGTLYFRQFDLLEQFNIESQSSVDKINETIQLSILDGTDIIYLGRRDANKPIRISTFPGTRFPAHTTAMGKILLSQFSYEQLHALFPGAQLEPKTPYTVKTLADLWQQIEFIHQTGYIIEFQESTIGFSCVAAPIYNSGKKIIAAISATLLESHQNENHEKALTEILHLSHRLSALAGYIG